MKDDPYYWYLALTVLCLGFEGVFTLAIKETQEWKFFCPSVFLYLARSGRHPVYMSIHILGSSILNLNFDIDTCLIHMFNSF